MIQRTPVTPIGAVTSLVVTPWAWVMLPGALAVASWGGTHFVRREADHPFHRPGLGHGPN